MFTRTPRETVDHLTPLVVSPRELGRSRKECGFAAEAKSTVIFAVTAGHTTAECALILNWQCKAPVMTAVAVLAVNSSQVAIRSFLKRAFWSGRRCQMSPRNRACTRSPNSGSGGDGYRTVRCFHTWGRTAGRRPLTSGTSKTGHRVPSPSAQTTDGLTSRVFFFSRKLGGGLYSSFTELEMARRSIVKGGAITSDGYRRTRSRHETPERPWTVRLGAATRRCGAIRQAGTRGMC
ncbi:hypothetical protein BLJAPNOD_04675 [Ensifer sp. M14]|nr:hypothetical protein BLJAPNOD_04675 [Ensifer sp. M14]